MDPVPYWIWKSRPSSACVLEAPAIASMTYFFPANATGDACYAGAAGGDGGELGASHGACEVPMADQEESLSDRRARSGIVVSWKLRPAARGSVAVTTLTSVIAVMDPACNV